MSPKSGTPITEVDFALGGDIADLHGTLRDLRAEGPVVRVRYYEEPAWLFTTYDAVEAAYRDDDLFPAAAAFKELTEPVLGRNLQCMHGAEHRRNRMLVSPAFRARAMPEVVRPIIDEVAHEIIDRFAARRRSRPRRRVRPRPARRRDHEVARRPPRRRRGLPALGPRAVELHRRCRPRAAARDEFTRDLAPFVTERRRDPRTTSSRRWPRRRSTASTSTTRRSSRSCVSSSPRARTRPSSGSATRSSRCSRTRSSSNASSPNPIASCPGPSRRCCAGSRPSAWSPGARRSRRRGSDSRSTPAPASCSASRPPTATRTASTPPTASTSVAGPSRS